MIGGWWADSDVYTGECRSNLLKNQLLSARDHGR